MRGRTRHHGGTRRRRGERGAALLEFTIGAVVFMTAVFAVLEFGRLLWVHNALTDAARRGARYAINHEKSLGAIADAQEMAVYGTTTPGDNPRPLVNDLKTTHVKVNHSSAYGVGQGSVSVTVEGYEFNFVVPIIGKTVKMPTYRTTLTGENAGTVPVNIP
ncbi:MAG TPA: TadE/TadG family type IV pilus assembly protein [Pyrinomonadaceae bacterium]|nr:TadE/TadG family type IV pilus assembly protein [Pyrinomonadaceae bacterium]